MGKLLDEQAEVKRSSHLSFLNRGGQKQIFDFRTHHRFSTDRIFRKVFTFVHHWVIAKDLWDVTHELVDISLSVDLLNDVLAIVVAETTAQLLIVHCGLVLFLSPHLGHNCRLQDLKFVVFFLGPLHQVRGFAADDELKKKLP